MNRIGAYGELSETAGAGNRVYRLTALQQGMLGNSVFREGSGIDIEQLVATLHEPLEIPRLAQAWQAVVDRHEALRAEFRWQGVDWPGQSFHDHVPVEIEEYDLRGLGELAQEQGFSAYLADDRQCGFDLSRPPLFRLACFRIAAEEYRLVWSFHHILIDGRSIRIVLEEVFDCYEALGCPGDWAPSALLPILRFPGLAAKQRPCGGGALLARCSARLCGPGAAAHRPRGRSRPGGSAVGPTPPGEVRGPLSGLLDCRTSRFRPPPRRVGEHHRAGSLGAAAEPL